MKYIKKELIIKLLAIVTCLVFFIISVLIINNFILKYFLFSSALFCVGIYGLLRSKTIIKSLISLEILFNSANINFICFAKYLDFSIFRGQAFALFVMAVAAVEIAIGFALIVQVYSQVKSNKFEKLSELKN